MNAEDAIPTPQEEAYATYEALTDPRDEALLIFLEAEGQPVGHLWRERRQELSELRAELGLDGHGAEHEAER